MIPNVEQTMNSSKVFLESQTNAFKTLASAALESTEKVTTLNLAAMKASAALASIFGCIFRRHSNSSRSQCFQQEYQQTRASSRRSFRRHLCSR